MSDSQRPQGRDSPAEHEEVATPTEPTEATPLLVAGNITDAEISEATTLNEPSSSEDEDKPLPKFQIFLLCYARLIEPIAFFSIFPYVSQMVQENGSLDDADVGFYSGLIESLFSLTQMAVMIFWGKASDRLGRKPVLVFSLIGVSIAAATFGMAKTIGQMILFRCIAGVFAGTIVTIRTMIAEHSTSKTQARAFSWFAFTGNMGIMLGPLLGGALADPAHQYPKVFRGEFFFKYPYALSSFVIGGVGASAALACALFVEETLARKSADDGEESGAQKPAQLSTWQLLKSPGVGIVFYVSAYMSVIAFGYTAIVPVFWYTPIALGGFGFTPLQISMMLAFNGLAQALWLLVVFPPLQHRIGTNGIMRICGYAWPVFFALAPFFNILLREGSETAVTTFWITVTVWLMLGSGIAMGYTGIQLAVNDVSPSLQVLGTLNALALAATSGQRAVCPALFTSLFAVGARTQLLWGYAIWVLMTVMTVGFSFAVQRLPNYDELKRRREE